MTSVPDYKTGGKRKEFYRNKIYGTRKITYKDINFVNVNLRRSFGSIQVKFSKPKLIFWESLSSVNVACVIVCYHHKQSGKKTSALQNSLKLLSLQASLVLQCGDPSFFTSLFPFFLPSFFTFFFLCSFLCSSHPFSYDG